MIPSARLLSLLALLLLVALPARAQYETCLYDADIAAVADLTTLVSDADAVVGAPDAGVTVVEFFDPNCPHCRTLHPTMKALQGELGDRVRFVYKPLVIVGNHSTAQVAALHLAAAQGMFGPMLDQQFATARRGGIPFAELHTLSTALGMTSDDFEADLQAFLPHMREQLDLFRSLGIRGVPAVLINGRAVAPSGRNLDCMKRLVEAELEG